ncbi:MAG: hypothetical protein V4673_02100 [Pseudomonadota bacterium]
MEILSVLVGGALTIAGTLLVSFFQARDRKWDRIDKLREAEERKMASKKEFQLAALRTVALALHRVSRDLSLSATVAALDSGETKDQFEARHRNLVNSLDAAHVQVIGYSPAVSGYLDGVSAAISRYWGHFGNTIRLNNAVGECKEEADDYQRAFGQTFKACGELSQIVAESLVVVAQEISDALN